MGYKNLDKQREYQRLYLQERRAAFFKDKCCVKCYSTVNLELDHINPDEKESHNIWSWAENRRLKELEKCQVLCSICHRDKTSFENSRSIRHGTESGYGRFCRCEECKAAHSSRMKLRIRQSAPP